MPVVAAVCGSDEGCNEDRTDSQSAVSESSGPALSDEASTSVAAEYGEAIGAINDRLKTRSEEIFAPVNQAFATLSPEGVLGVIANALPLASEATADSLRDLSALTPTAYLSPTTHGSFRGGKTVLRCMPRALRPLKRATSGAPWRSRINLPPMPGS